MRSPKLLAACAAWALGAGLASAQTSPARPGRVLPATLEAIQPAKAAPEFNERVTTESSPILPVGDVVLPEGPALPPPPPPGRGPLIINPYVGSPYPSSGPTAAPRGFGYANEPGAVCNPDSFMWIDAEYILWHLGGYTPPALVTTSPVGAVPPFAGTFADPNARILFGNSSIREGWYSGFRIGTGFWLNAENTLSLESSGFLLPRSTGHFHAQSNGDPGLFRPFFNTSLDQLDSSIISFINPAAVPGVLTPIAAGSIDIEHSTQLGGLNIDLRGNIFQAPRQRLDWIIGYRYLELQDRIRIHERTTAIDPTSVDPLPGTVFDVNDAFDCDNMFNGINLGFGGEYREGQLSVLWTAKVALGQTRRVTKIDGGTEVTPPGGVAPILFPGGLLAQTSNIGKHTENDFSAVPELAVKMAWDLNANWRVTGGYSMLFWPRVARAGQQIDTQLSQVPPDPITGFGRPIYQSRESDLFVHGGSVGIEFRY